MKTGFLNLSRHVIMERNCSEKEQGLLMGITSTGKRHRSESKGRDRGMSAMRKRLYDCQGWTEEKDLGKDDE